MKQDDDIKKYCSFVNWSEVSRELTHSRFTINPLQGKLPKAHRATVTRILAGIKKAIDEQQATPDEAANKIPHRGRVERPI